jgi:hypothetical protein
MRESWGKGLREPEREGQESIQTRATSIRPGKSRCVTLPREAWTSGPAPGRWALRITVGSAPGRKSCLSMKAPRTGRTSAADHGQPQRQAQVEMGEGVAHLETGVVPIGADGGAGAGIALRPVAPGPAQHAAQKAEGGRVSKKEGAIAAPDKIGDAMAHRLGLSSGSWRAGRPRCPVAAPRILPSAGRCRRRGISACRWSRRGP